MHMATLIATLLIMLLAKAGDQAFARNVSPTMAPFRAAEVALSHHSDGIFLDDDPRAPALLRRIWTIAGQRAIDYLNRHPATSAPRLRAAIGKLSRNLRVETVELDARTYLVSVSLGDMGTVFIVTNPDKQSKVAWTIADLAAHPPPGLEILSAWSGEQARLSCRRSETGDEFGFCGPVSSDWYGGAIGKLPDQGDGSHRFYLTVGYAQRAGATVGGQLSLWRWTGRTAEPLLARTYVYTMDQKLRLQVDGNLLRVGIKDNFQSFFVTSPEEGRQLVWTIRSDPDRIVDLGKASTVPELDLVDTLIQRLLKKEPASDIASPVVATKIESKIADVQKDNNFSELNFAFGELFGWHLESHQQQKQLCVATDIGGSFRFDIITVHGKPWLSTATEVPEAECER